MSKGRPQRSRHNIKFSKRISTYQILHVATLMFKGTETMHEKITFDMMTLQKFGPFSDLIVIALALVVTLDILMDSNTALKHTTQSFYY